MVILKKFSSMAMKNRLKNKNHWKIRIIISQIGWSPIEKVRLKKINHKLFKILKAKMSFPWNLILSLIQNQHIIKIPIWILFLWLNLFSFMRHVRQAKIIEFLDWVKNFIKMIILTTRIAIIHISRVFYWNKMIY